MVAISTTDTTATVTVPGLAAPLRALHLSDSHISLSSDNQPHSERMHTAFVGADGAGRVHHVTGEKMLPRDRFEQQVAGAAADGTDLIMSVPPPHPSPPHPHPSHHHLHVHVATCGRLRRLRPDPVRPDRPAAATPATS